MKPLLLLIISVVICSQMLFPLVKHLDNLPYVQKLGYVPNEQIIRLGVADQKTSYAAALVFKTMMYFGGLVGKSLLGDVRTSPDFDGMAQNIKTVAKIDPYNMDAYYFAQAIFTWDAGRITEANELLEYGMSYRDWDFYLPYFVGFNYAYFLKDYESAAKYYQRAADLTGDDLLVRLTSRYMYEARQTDLAISYLKTMIPGARNAAVKQSLALRLQALEELRIVEVAVKKFFNKNGRPPQSMEELMDTGCLATRPVDPYGGRIYLNVDGEVKTSSKLAHAGGKHERN